MEKIIMDVDTGVDDYIAILLASMSKKFDILGITTVAGNCSLENATRNTIKVLDMAGCQEVKVYKGMAKSLSVEKEDASYVHGTNGLGNVPYQPIEKQAEEKSAIDFLIESANTYGKELTLIATGPLTNIASVIRQDSEFPNKIKRIVIMGGAENLGNVTPYAEFNFSKDCIAASEVVKAEFPEMIVVGLNVTNRNCVTEQIEQLLLDINTKESKYLYDITRIGTKFDIEELGLEGFAMHDSVTIAYLIDPTCIKLKDVSISVITEGEREGESVIENEPEIPTCKFAYDIDVKKVQEIIFTTIFKEQAEKIKAIL